MSRRPHEPTEKDRKTVKAMKAYGIPEAKIAAVIGIHVETMGTHYRHELDTAEAEANAEVAQSLFRNATKHNNVTAQCFWLKTRAGYREVLRLGGEPGAAPVILQVVSGVDRAEAAIDAADETDKA